jgi:hypothetical protein
MEPPLRAVLKPGDNLVPRKPERGFCGRLHIVSVTPIESPAKTADIYRTRRNLCSYRASAKRSAKPDGPCRREGG